MKKLFLAVSFGFSALFFAQESSSKKFSPPPGKALVGDFYGAGVTSDAE